MKTSSWLCSLRAISVSLQGCTEMERSAPQAVDNAAAEKGDSLCTANPVNPGYFRVPSAAMQRVMWLGGRDEPERDSGQGQRKQIPLRSSCFSRGELPSRGASSHQARTVNTKRHFVLWKFYRSVELTKLCMVDTISPPGPRLVILPLLNPPRRSKIDGLQWMGWRSARVRLHHPSSSPLSLPARQETAAGTGNVWRKMCSRLRKKNKKHTKKINWDIKMWKPLKNAV